MLVRATANCFFSSVKEYKLVLMVILVWILAAAVMVLTVLVLLAVLLLLLLLLLVQIVGKVDEKVEGLGLREYLAPGGEIQGTTTTMSCES